MKWFQKSTWYMVSCLRPFLDYIQGLSFTTVSITRTQCNNQIEITTVTIDLMNREPFRNVGLENCNIFLKRKMNRES